MLFESMPSVALSTYAILINDINYDKNGYNKANTSILVSLLFSFINITNTVVSLLENDKTQNNDAAMVMHQINAHGTKN